jgi:hypothetical protein
MLKIATSCFLLVIVVLSKTTQYFLTTLKLYFSQFTVPASYSLQIWNHPRIQVPLQKEYEFGRLATIDGGLLQDAAQMKLNVLCTVHLTAEP